MNGNLQDEVISFLSEPGAYHSSASHVERHETHGAIVFLVADKAYKLKRAVHLPYMDYSTVELRHKMCLRELEVNCRMAPEIYLGVVPVIRANNGALQIATCQTATNVVDWLVVMRRFPQDALLENMRRAGLLSIDILRRAAVRIAQFHAGSEVHRDSGGYEGISAIIDENQMILGQMIGRPFSQEKVRLLYDLAHPRLEAIRSILEHRREDGYVRRVHGDLHLNNICVFNGEPVPFDALEFREDFSRIDTFYDLAFLLMDLDRHGLCAGANVVLNAYLEQSLDYTGLAPLPLFLACRAAIRAHVTMAMARANVQPASAERDASAFLDRALNYLRPPAPRLVAVGGISGTGKSTLARTLAPAIGAVPGAVILRSDVIRKELWGITSAERLPEKAYTAEASRQVFHTIAGRAEIILRTGHSVVADAVYGQPEERAALAKVATRIRTPFLGLWLDAPVDVLASRISTRTNDASDATVAVLHKQLQSVTAPDNWRVIKAGSGPEDTFLQAVRHLERT